MLEPFTNAASEDNRTALVEIQPPLDRGVQI